MNRPQYTKNQQDAIDVLGGNILVSAAAGSGKTAVLTERVIRLLTGENGIEADRLIIVTFTVLAAEEMRHRISGRLSELLAADPTNKRLQSQQLLLAKAKISTIHSLCSGLMRDNFQKLSISADFRIADETEITIIKNDSIEEVMSDFYTAEDKEFLELVEFTSVRNDDKLCELALSVYDFIRSFAYPKRFLEEALLMYQTCGSIGKSVWYKDVFYHISQALQSAITSLDDALFLIENDAAVKDSYFPAFSSDRAQLVAILDDLMAENWDSAVEKSANFERVKLKAVRKYEDKGFLEELKQKRENSKQIFKKTATRYLNCTAAEFQDDIQILTKKTQKLFEIVTQLYDLIEAKKQEQNILDYADLEHYTLRLLVDPKTGNKTDIAEILSQSFDEIMIDECQDINEVQSLIFQTLSKNEQNLFMVGDVKQSVYRFRKAMPQLFIEKKRRFAPYDSTTHTNSSQAVITLESNFRSRAEVCDTVNWIFSQIMSEQMGEIEYDNTEELVAKASYPAYSGAFSEIHVVEHLATDDRDKTVVEAQYIGELIKQMITDGYEVSGKNGMRRCQFGDFAILLRAKKGKADVFSKELTNMGISCFSDTAEGYFGEYEITIAINLLRVIDNPLLDVCLLSVLMSPMFSFSADTVTAIRLVNKAAPLYLAMAELAEAGDLQCKSCIAILAALRQKSVTAQVDELLQEIYDQTDFIALSHVISVGSGRQRDANLRLLLTYAKQYESMGTGGLSGFLRYIDRVIDGDQDFSCANIAAHNSDTVKIMSIHGSKGLEFPICIVADCAKGFNKMDLNKGHQMNSRLGFSMKISDNDTLKSYASLPFEAIRLQSEKEAISEEMRVLYVALTRAKEKLIMVTTLKKPHEKLAEIAASLGESFKLPPFNVYSSDSYSDWILEAALRHPDLSDIRQEIGASTTPVIQAGFKLKAFFKEAPQIETTKRSKQQFISPVDLELARRLEATFGYEYPFKTLTQIPAKLTATLIAKQGEVHEVSLKLEPRFLSSKGLSPADKGTVLHNFMQYCDFAAAKIDLPAEINRLVSKRFITKVEAEVLDTKKIAAFLCSPLYARMEVASGLFREYKFLHFIKAGEVDSELEGEFADKQILIQGIADCIMVENNHITIIDYKTDFEKDEQVLIERYRNQLKTYKGAVENAFNLPVSQCLLYSLSLGREIEIFIE